MTGSFLLNIPPFILTIVFYFSYTRNLRWVDAKSVMTRPYSRYPTSLHALKLKAA